jgi:EmrB/QacA subfamily drug resistance transporter
MRKWGPLLAVCLGTFMLLLDVTIVAVALPDMATDLGAGLSDLQWVMDIYALALAVILLATGSAADRYGRRLVYVLGMVTFTAASLACGVAPGVATLVAARGAQGLGGAAMFATTLSILGATYRGRDRTLAFGVWGAVAGGAAATGPVLGGVLTDAWGWRWIFLVNLPVAVAAVALTLAVVAESRGERRPFDLLGVVTFTVLAGSSTYAVIRADRVGWSSTRTLVPLIVAAVALLLFVAIERRTAYPMLDLSLFRRPSFVAIMLAAFALQSAAFAVLPYLSIWLQTVLGLSPIRGGLVFLPLSVSAFVTAAVGGRLLHGRPPRWPIGIGLLFVGAGTFAESFLARGSTWTATVAGFVLIGIGVGLVNPAVSDAALASAPPERAGMAGGAVNTFRQIGYALGVAVFGSIAVARMQHVMTGTVADPHTAAHALSSGGARMIVSRAPAGLHEQAERLTRTAFAAGLDHAAVAAAIVAVVAGLVVILLVHTGPPGRHRLVPADAAAEPATRRGRPM